MLEFRVNNNNRITMEQGGQYGTIDVVVSERGRIIDREYIPAEDMVMLFNYYRYIKRNDIECEFINPNGTSL